MARRPNGCTSTLNDQVLFQPSPQFPRKPWQFLRAVGQVNEHNVVRLAEKVAEPGEVSADIAAQNDDLLILNLKRG